MKRLLATAALVLFAATADGRPPYKKALADLLNLPASSRLNDCRVCHLPGKGDDDRPHNAFGERLKKVRAELKSTNKPFDITARLLAVAAEDADGDGVANLLELLAGTAPGDATDKPTGEAIEKAKIKQAELLASLAGYRWRPFDRVERPDVPAIKDRTGAQNPIDLFLAAERDKRGLSPRPEAPKPVLLRRLHLDLTGLPPTPDELHAFLSDHRPDAYERLVERLLASPRFGERWGRHWMDVWRYSDWAGWGAQVRDSQPHIWHWRDWIVESLNADKPYDRMAQEMLAADELVPEDAGALRATGYLVRNYKLLSREKWMQDTVDHTAMAFLGVTLGCARCHDHMYDPITQKEYYQVRAIFTPHHVRTDRLPGWPDLASNGLPRAFDKDLKAQTFLFTRGDDRSPEKTPLDPAVPEALGGRYEARPVALPRLASAPDRRPFVLAELAATLEKNLEFHDKDISEAKYREALASLAAGPLGPLGPLAVAERHHHSAALHREGGVESARKTRLLAKVEQLEDAGRQSGPEWEAAARELVASERRFAYLIARNRLFQLRHGFARPEPKSKVPPAKLLADAAKATADAEAALKLPPSTKYKPRDLPSYPATSTGRRLEFARWLTRRDNPLAARVAVNQVWQRHFGTGIVPNSSDFGRNGQPPTHPALLDWLAVEFMERGWSLKELHRLIVTSAAYRQDSTPSPEKLSRDPDNVYLWRFAPRRLEAEAVRDAVFHVAGSLDLSLGGPELPHTAGLTAARRSVYFQHAQEKQMEFLQIFDTASVTECYSRKQAILPQQALALVNSDLVRGKAAEVARQIGGDDSAFVRSAFERVLSRAPTPEESAACGEFLRGRGGRANLVHVLYNHHEFTTIR